MVAIPKISIVMSNYNRIDQLEITLNSFKKSSLVNDIEVIIVDDASHDQNLVKMLIYKYNFNIKLYTISHGEKSWVNPCVPYNIGLKMALGELIIIQNPEVCHVGDVISFLYNNTDDNAYNVLSVFSSPSTDHNDKIKQLNLMDIYDTNKFVKSINYELYVFDYAHYKKSYSDVNSMTYDQALAHWKTIGISSGRHCNESKIYHPDEYVNWKGWYNHPNICNRPLHFLSAITKNNLEKIGGFDGNFRDGLWYDDDDFLNRIKKICDVNNILPNNCYGIHLFHLSGSFQQTSKETFARLVNVNKNMYADNIKKNIIFCKNESIIDFNNIIKNNDVQLKNFKIALMIKTFSDEFTSNSRIKIFETCIKSAIDFSGECDIILFVDGCKNAYHSYLLDKYGSKIKIIRFRKNRGVGGATNYSIKYAIANGYDVGICSDDDMIFKDGFIKYYLEHILLSGIDHLCYYPMKELYSAKQVEQICTETIRVNNTKLVRYEYGFSGCFYTVTPRMISKIGYLPVFNYKYGYEHELLSKNYFHFSKDVLNISKYENTIDCVSSNNYVELNKNSLTFKSMNVDVDMVNKNKLESEQIVVGNYVKYDDTDPRITFIVKTSSNSAEDINCFLRKIISLYQNYELIIINDNGENYDSLSVLKQINYVHDVTIINALNSRNNNILENALNLLSGSIIIFCESSLPPSNNLSSLLYLQCDILCVKYVDYHYYVNTGRIKNKNIILKCFANMFKNPERYLVAL